MNANIKSQIDCKTDGFFLKISKEIDKACRKSLTRAKHALSVFSLVPDLLFHCSRVLEYAKIRTILESKSQRKRESVYMLTRNSGNDAENEGKNISKKQKKIANSLDDMIES